MVHILPRDAIQVNMEGLSIWYAGCLFRIYFPCLQKNAICRFSLQTHDKIKRVHIQIGSLINNFSIFFYLVLYIYIYIDLHIFVKLVLDLKGNAIKYILNMLKDQVTRNRQGVCNGQFIMNAWNIDELKRTCIFFIHYANNASVNREL